MITLKDYWMGRDKTHAADLTEAIRANADITVDRINKLLHVARWSDARVSSGWRPPSVNAGVKGAAKRSKHMTGEACDIADPKGDLGRWCLGNLKELERQRLWLEHPTKTPTWVHLQIVAPKSGRRVFLP